MFTFSARQRAKRQYVRETEEQAHRVLLNSKLAAMNAANARKQAEALNAEAQAIDDNIKAVAETEEKGYWLCENGHESVEQPNLRPAEDRPANLCVVNVDGKECGAEVKLIRRDLMSGQERYESDKERNEAVKIAEQKRQAAEERAKFAEGAEKASQSFREQAQRGIELAKQIKNL